MIEIADVLEMYISFISHAVVFGTIAGVLLKVVDQ